MNTELYKISFEGISKDCVALLSFDLVYGKLYYVTLFYVIYYVLYIVFTMLHFSYYKVAFVFRNR